MNISKIAVAMVLFTLFPLVVSAGNLSDQTLIKGQSSTLTVDYAIGDVAITDQSVCDYVVQDNRKDIYLNPKKEGRVSLTMWDASGVKQDSVVLSIIAVGSNEILEDAKAAFENSGSLKFFMEGNNVVIRGEASSAQELAKIQAFAAQFPQVKNEVSVAKAVLDTISSEIEKAIATPGIRVRSVRDRLILEGTAYSQEAFVRAEKIAKLYDENVLNLVFVKDTKRNPASEKLIQLDVQFMEVKKNAIRSFGINWAPGSVPASGSSNASIGGGGASAGTDAMGLSGLANSIIGFAFNLAPKIKFARQKGDARVLENPSFVIKSGETADFFSGTQVPYYSQQAVIFKDVGIKIQAEPISSAEDVDLKINITVTSPSAGGINKGIDTQTISTTAYCKAGSSLALGGIFRNADARTYNRIPEDLNTSSALFSLFLSKDFMSNRSEFVVFVTPRIVENPSNLAGTSTLSRDDWDGMNEDIIKKRSKKEYREYMKEKNGNARLMESTKDAGPKDIEVKKEETSVPEPVAIKEEAVFELPESLKN